MLYGLRDSGIQSPNPSTPQPLNVQKYIKYQIRWEIGIKQRAEGGGQRADDGGAEKGRDFCLRVLSLTGLYPVICSIRLQLGFAHFSERAVEREKRCIGT